MSHPWVGGRALVLVEGDAARSAIAGALREVGLEVLAFTDPAHALQRLKRDTVYVPDHAVLDWIGGTADLLRYLVSTPTYVRTRIVVLTDTPDDVPSLCVSALLPRRAPVSDVLAIVGQLARATLD